MPKSKNRKRTKAALRGFGKLTRDLTEHRQADENARKLAAERAARAAAEAAEKRIRESEERYRTSSEQLNIILQGVADGITVQDGSGRLIFANGAAARASGFQSPEKLLALGAEDVFARLEFREESGSPVPPDRLPGRRALLGEAPPPTLLRVRERASGRLSWSIVSASAVRDSDGKPYLAITIWHDVTKRRRAGLSARFLAEATAVLAASLDYETTLQRVARLAVPDIADWCAVDIVGEEGGLRSVAVAHIDPAKVELARELIRRYARDLNAPRGAPAVIRTGQSELYPEIPDQMLVEAAVDEEDLRIARELGLKSAMVVPLGARLRSLGAITFVSAESGRSYTAEDLALAEDLGRRAGLALDNALLYRQAQQAIQARDEFLSIASHELRTPCTSLHLQLESLLRTLGRNPIGRLGPRLQRNAEIALRQTDRLNRLIEELLDVSRIAAGKLTLELEELDLGALVLEVVARFVRASEEASAPLRVSRPEAPAVGTWDRLRLEQVVSNLVSNAIKYGRGQPVDVAIDGDAKLATLAVRDGGIGISPEDQVRIFEPFERAVSIRHYGGFGLGLWITRTIVDAHGGTISVSSKPGAGATFTVALPRHF